MAFRRRGPTDPDAVRRAADSFRSIEAGGLPLAAQERLANLRAHGGSYTSDLSTAEFLLIREAGFRPLSQVMGSCFYQTGFQYMPGTPKPASFRPEGQSTAGSAHSSGYEYDAFGRRVYSNAAFGQVFELDVESEAWREARRLALDRLTQEARLAGADAVVGVHLRRGTYDWSRNLIEFVAVGTAVASDRYDLGDDPVLSSLSGQDFAALYASGYWPAGIVVGTTVIYVMTGWQQKLAHRRFAPNQELRDYTQGVQHARKVAMSHVAREAGELGAAGVVGLSLDVSRREHEHEGSGSWSRHQKDLIVTVHALGTAIVELDRRTDPPPVHFALSLNEERR
jgi:uncharacterized protein YbjQ (UPF0145 family)